MIEMTKAKKTLSEYGIRPTEMRLKIYKYLKRKRYAVSLFDIKKSFLEKSETNKTANKTTFFRVVNLFLEKGIVHQIDDGTGIAKFAISEGNTLSEKGKDLHLHFHCIECNRTFCLQDRMTDACLPTDYEIKEVNLVLKGICKNCIMS